jgi:aminoglycoside phosphotransferase (APT) family kinase protein
MHRRSWGVVAHNDAAPYNAVWRDGELIGFIDWDMAGPRRREDDLAWTAFSWVPLHARHVVAAEGFTDFGRRRARLSAFLDSYGSLLTLDEVIARLAVLIDDQIRLMRQRASAGDATYQRMLEHGRAHALEIGGGELLEI